MATLVPPPPLFPADLGPGRILSYDFFRKMLLQPTLQGQGLTGSPGPSHKPLTPTPSSQAEMRGPERGDRGQPCGLIGSFRWYHVSQHEEKEDDPWMLEENVI